MAWPVSARYQSFTANVTRITAAFLNSAQDVIYAIYGGTKTLVSLEVDGTGNQAAAPGAGNILASGDIDANGSMSADLIVLSPGGVTADGNIESTGGDVYATVGDVYAVAGNVYAAGDPASDQGRVKGKQIVSTTAAKPTIAAANKTGSDNGAGDATASVANGSTDIKGRITVTSGAATGNGDICRVTFNKAYPSAPEVVLVPTSQNTVDLGWVPHVTTAATYFDITSGTGANKLATATAYGWAYIVVG